MFLKASLPFFGIISRLKTPRINNINHHRIIFNTNNITPQISVIINKNPNNNNYDITNIRPYSSKPQTTNGLYSSISISNLNPFFLSSSSYPSYTLEPFGFICRHKYHKLKTHSGTKKRWRSLGGNKNKFKRSQVGRRHLNTGVSRTRLRRLQTTKYSNRNQVKKLKRLMPYG